MNLSAVAQKISEANRSQKVGDLFMRLQEILIRFVFMVFYSR